MYNEELELYKYKTLYPRIKEEINRLAAERVKAWDVFEESRTETNPCGNYALYTKYKRTWEREDEARDVLQIVLSIDD